MTPERALVLQAWAVGLMHDLHTPEENAQALLGIIDAADRCTTLRTPTMKQVKVGDQWVEIPQEITALHDYSHGPPLAGEDDHKKAQTILNEFLRTFSRELLDTDREIPDLVKPKLEEAFGPVVLSHVNQHLVIRRARTGDFIILDF